MRMTGRLLPALAPLAWGVLSGCPQGSGEPCKRVNHCVRHQDGSVSCEPGYTWRDPTNPDDLVCVPSPAPCGPCVPPAAWCDGSQVLVTHTPAGCDGSTCQFVASETRCALGCDDVAGTCVGCVNPCPSPGATQCHDGRIRGCLADGNGCLDWGPFITCGTDTCIDAGHCADCVDACAPAGGTECEGGQLRTCVIDVDGCLRFSGFFPCESGECRSATACKEVIGPTSTSSCSVDGWCWAHPLPNGNSLSAVWSLGGSTWVAGSGGTLMHHDSEGWSFVPARLRGAIEGLAGPSVSRLWAVGEEGVIWQYDGDSWTPAESPTNEDLHSAWCAGADDCWAVGDETLLRYDGSGWRTWPLTFPVLSLYDVWGTASTDVWAVGYGYGGVILHWNGTSWSSRSADLGVWTRFVRVWGRGVDDVWAVHDSGPEGLYHWQGGPTWEHVVTGSGARLSAVWGRGDTDLWVGGEGTLLHWDSLTWSSRTDLGDMTLLDLGGDAERVWGVGSGGTVLLHQTGEWERLAGSPAVGTEVYAAIHGQSATDIWAAGSHLGRFAGGAWAMTPLPAAPAAYTATGLWTHGSNAWVACDNGRVLSLGAGGWEVMAERGEALRGLWGVSADALWAVADSGTVHHWNGTTWTTTALGSGAAGLWAISGSGPEDVFVVGDEETAHHWDGSDWTEVHSRYQGDWLTAVWSAGPHEIWAGGSDALLHHWDGTTWTTMPSGTWQWIQGIWGLSARDVWAVASSAGGHGAILHYDGESWREVVSHAGPALRGIWASPDGELWVAGAQAATLRRK